MPDPNDAICIGCGCSEFDPCMVKHRDGQSPCAWIVVDRRTQRGVCCAPQCRATALGRWDAGDRELSDAAKKRVGAKANG